MHVFFGKQIFFSTNLILLLIWVNCCAHFKRFFIRQRVKGVIPREEKNSVSWEISLLQYVHDIPAPMQCSIMVARLIMVLIGNKKQKREDDFISLLILHCCFTQKDRGSRQGRRQNYLHKGFPWLRRGEEGWNEKRIIVHLESHKSRSEFSSFPASMFV